MIPEMALWLRLVLAAVCAMAVCFAAGPSVRSFARRVGAMDQPGEARRVHTQATPRLGGLAIFLGFLVGVLPFCPISRPVQGILLGCILIVTTGAIDDLINLSPWVKLLSQFAAALVAVAHGVSIEVLTHPNLFITKYVILDKLALPITIVWIMGVTNAVNLIDGLDGLAVGVSIISSITMLIVALTAGQSPESVVLLAALAGACMGFVPYNKNPATLFMGDTGALLLGYLLATVSVLGLFKMYALVTFAVPLLALAVPLSDTVFAILRRILKGQNPMLPDRGHLHHRLLDLGLSQKQAVAVLYAVSAILGLAAVVLTTGGITKYLLIFAAFAVAVTVWLFVFPRKKK